jgi:uncharacterized membrane protein
MIVETKKRTIFKSLSWRIVAVMNSWTILSFGFIESNFWNAIIMNISGLVFFYAFERVWSKINYGRNVTK